MRFGLRCVLTVLSTLYLIGAGESILVAAFAGWLIGRVLLGK